jgi:hypothetical protein
MDLDINSIESKVGAPKGNDNARKGKLFYGELRKTLVQNDALRLRAIAEKLVGAAEEGEAWAVKEIMDRMDGKPLQATSIENPDGTAITGIQVTFVKPSE